MNTNLGQMHWHLTNRMPLDDTGSFSSSDVANWVGTHYPELTRRQANSIGRILWGWVAFGYVPNFQGMSESHKQALEREYQRLSIGLE